MRQALLVTIFRVPNFGSVLQAYATQCVIESMGFDCRILNYDHNKGEWAKAHGVKPTSLKNKIGRYLGLKASHRKANKLDEFIDKNFHLTHKYSRFDDICQGEGCKSDLFVVGSDQIWNTRYTHCDPVFLLKFADDSKRRVSIASSFACKKMNERYESEFKMCLKRFNALSVREALGLGVLSDLGIPNAYQVLDPTLLLDINQWNTLRKNKTYSEKYILLYMLSYAIEPRPYIYEVLKFYQEKLQCKIVALEGYSGCQAGYVKALNIEDATDSSITDFLDLFANASLVVTTSFHGTAFAANYGIPLISIVPNNDDDRQSSLMKQLGLEQCCLIVNENMHKANPFYDKNVEQRSLQTLRDDSLNWIEKVLK